MGVIKTKIDLQSKNFLENYSFIKAFVKDYKKNLEDVKKKGSYAENLDVLKKFKKKKLDPRERIRLLLDQKAQFLELSPLAAWKMYNDEVPGAGMITGIGVIQGIECMIIANHFLIKGGSYFPMTVKKHLRAQEVAWENQLPCVYLVDSGGAFLPLQSEVFPDKEHFGRIFYNQARMSADGIPQISVVLGSCTAGGAYVPSMSDENIIVKNQGTIFLGGPPLVKAATGEEVDDEELGGAEVHSKKSGVSDHLVESEKEAFQKVRDIFSHLKHLKNTERHSFSLEEVRDPLYSADEIYGILPKDGRQFFDIREIIARIVDGSEFHEFKEFYSPSLVTGFSKIWGFSVGIVANNGVLFNESALKAAHFIELCNQREIPIIFLQNITGFMVGKSVEHKGIAKDGAKMVMAVSNSRVPMFSIVIGGSYGAGNYGMCGRAFQPRFLWMWPTAKIAVMGGKQAAQVLFELKQKQRLKNSKRLMTNEEEVALKAPLLKKYAHESSAYYSTARLWDDGIIDPVETRKYLSLALSISLNGGLKRRKTFRGLNAKEEIFNNQKKQGVFRM